MTTATSPPPTRKASFGKRLLFRVLAVLISLSPLILLEIGFRLTGMGQATDYDDPFVGFSDIHPLFVRNDETGRYEIPKSRQTHFRPDWFAIDKAPDEFRIFVLGGSTVQGRPYFIETSFTTWLELSLDVADPSREWEVVNCGGVSYASYRLVPILREVLGYQPDLIIVCTGQNEFLEDRSYGHLKTESGVLTWSQQNVSSLRTYNVFRGAILDLLGESPQPDIPEGRPILGPESDAMLDWEGGMAGYERDPEWQADVMAHYRFNLRHLADIAALAEVPFLFVSPMTNLEWPPFKPEHRDDITPEDEEEFAFLLDEAQRRSMVSLADAMDLLEFAIGLDDQHAMAHYHMGMYLKAQGRLEEAEQSLIRAKDLDICPLRMLEPMKVMLHEVAAETDMPLFDAEALLAAYSRSGFPDNQWLIDHVHPTVEGHQLIAEGLVGELTRLGFLEPKPGWEAERDQAYAAHLDTLDEAYFAWGDMRLKAVQAWGHGLAVRKRK